MSEQSRPSWSQQSAMKSASPPAKQAIKFLVAVTIGAALLFLSGITLTGTVIALIVATPVLILFSPILVPAGTVVCLAISGFLFSSGCGLAAITALSWIYNYVSGKQPAGADQMDYARARIAEMKERAKEYGQYVQSKGQEATQAS